MSLAFSVTQNQIMPGIFEHTIDYLVENKKNQNNKQFPSKPHKILTPY